MIEKLKSIKIAEIMTRPVVCTSPDSSAYDILAKLNSTHFSGLPVVEDHVVMGIVSEKDILQLVLQGKNLKTTPVSEFMTRDVVTADQDCAILPLLKAFIDNQVLRLPVTHQGKLVGIVTRHDLLKLIIDSTPEFPVIS
ncbi:MAG: CBS domain-containing protein [Nitrospina sp.]|nr:CBS domain-containing protein [Nitrospina sp.]MBT6716090.1 CBS domain-containing protein [Nitrospina sp.]